VFQEECNAQFYINNTCPKECGTYPMLCENY
jgi:hypothetical protein